jgi:hypothetical protein
MATQRERPASGRVRNLAGTTATAGGMTVALAVGLTFLAMRANHLTGPPRPEPPLGSQGLAMFAIPTISKLATLLTGAALAGGLAPSAGAHPSASSGPHPRVSVNSSTGYATPIPTAHRNRAPDQELYVNPDTGFAYRAQGSVATGGAPTPG